MATTVGVAESSAPRPEWNEPRTGSPRDRRPDVATDRTSRDVGLEAGDRSGGAEGRSGTKGNGVRSGEGFGDRVAPGGTIAGTRIKLRALFPGPKHSFGVYSPRRRGLRMSIELGRTFGLGVRRAASASGAVLFVLTLAAQYVLVSAVNTLIRSGLPPDLVGDVDLGLTLPVSGSIAGVLAASAIVLGAAAYLVGARAMAREIAELNSLPSRLIAHRPVRGTLSILVASVVVVVAITMGIPLIVPGLFLAVSFAFVPFVVAVEDGGPLTALRRSWGLATGNRWRLFAVLLPFVLLHGVVSTVGAAFSLAAPGVGQLINLTAGSIVTVLSVGVLAEAFGQLREAEADAR